MGDEGKGKIIDWLSEKADMVVRFQGGNNAGHTIVSDNKTYKLSLLPSGVISGRQSLIGSGVVINAKALFKEIETLKSQGISVTRSILGIASKATLILPFHIELDKAREESSNVKIGTTKNGIGPAYEDRVGRRALHVYDLLAFVKDEYGEHVYPERLKEVKARLHDCLQHYNALLRGYGHSEFQENEILDYIEKIVWGFSFLWLMTPRWSKSM